MFKLTVAIALLLIMSVGAYAAGPLPPGKPAGAKEALVSQNELTVVVILVVGVGVAALGLFFSNDTHSSSDTGR